MADLGAVFGFDYSLPESRHSSGTTFDPDPFDAFGIDSDWLRDLAITRKRTVVFYLLISFPTWLAS